MQVKNDVLFDYVIRLIIEDLSNNNCSKCIISNHLEEDSNKKKKLNWQK